MEATRSLLLPAQGLGDRVIAKARDLVVIPLMETHAGSTQQVNGGDDLHA